MARSEEELMTPRAAKPGMARYVYSAAEVDELLAVVWTPAVDKGRAAARIEALGVSGGQLYDAIRRARPPKAAAAPAPKAAARQAPATRGAGQYYGTCSCGCGSKRECVDP